MTECTSVPRCPCHLRHCLFQIEVQCFFSDVQEGCRAIRIAHEVPSWPPGQCRSHHSRGQITLHDGKSPWWWKITLHVGKSSWRWKITLMMENHPDDGKLSWWSWTYFLTDLYWQAFEKVLSSNAHITKGLDYRPLLPWLGTGLLNF